MARRAVSFGEVAGAYHRARPGYPDEILRWALPDGARRVLDLGAGTGKLTDGLLTLGLEVVAVEPLAGMRDLIAPEATALEGAAEEIPLPDASVDSVLAGQAFHWFDAARALPEIRRVLRPGGTVALMWNLIDDSVPWVKRLAELYGAEDRAGRWPLAEDDRDPPYTSVPGLGEPVLKVLPHSKTMTVDELLDLVRSRSTTILLAEDERAALLREVVRVAPPEPFEMPYLCAAWRGLRRP